MAQSLPEKILQYLDQNGKVDSLELSSILKEESQKIVGAIKSLEALGNVISVEQYTKKQWELTAEGKLVVQHGSHESVVYNAVPQEGIPQPELMKKVPNAKVGFSKAMSSGWIILDKSSGQPIIRRKVAEISDVVQLSLAQVEAGKNNALTEEQKQEYKKRKLLQEIVVKGFQLTKGSEFSLSVSKPETDLTPEMIAQGTWRTKQFKDYNLGALGVPPTCGHLHPLLKVRAEFRQIFLEMGFSEMPTNNFVESSFWNFDALFQPQQHPARDAHDTFFLSEPKSSSQFPADYLARVKEVHSHGGYGSQGYGYDWKIEEAQKNLLRTHTTAVSARMLYSLAQKGFQPVKYFSIDRVFRNETLDATHLAEFHQVEGVVADYDLSLGDLIGTLYEFFKKLGIPKLYFKPAYNPYTEPSMEIFSYHEGLKKWMEVGNSGIFRPEMLLPMGIPANVNVIAWGLSLERPTMIKYGIDNIRDLVGPKVDLQMVQDCPICRLDKDSSTLQLDDEEKDVEALENEWDSLVERLQTLQQAVTGLKFKLGLSGQTTENPKNIDITIFADPMYPPYGVLILANMIANQFGIGISTHCHSSINNVSSKLIKIFSNTNENLNNKSNNYLCIIWKSVGTNLELVVSPVSHVKIIGEVNAVRYLSRMLEVNSKNMNWFENVTVDHSTQVDYWLDKAHEQLLLGPKKTQVFLRSLDTQLSAQNYIVGKSITPADVYVFSILYNLKTNKLPSNVETWYNKCKSFGWMP